MGAARLASAMISSAMSNNSKNGVGAPPSRFGVSGNEISASHMLPRLDVDANLVHELQQWEPATASSFHMPFGYNVKTGLAETYSESDASTMTPRLHQFMPDHPPTPRLHQFTCYSHASSVATERSIGPRRLPGELKEPHGAAHEFEEVVPFALTDSALTPRLTQFIP